MRTRSVETSGVGLEVLEAGAGGRPLLLVHGFTGAKEDFADHLDALAARGWHVVAPDNRGHGASAQPDGPYSLATFAADVVALADALGWDRFVLLGHSMGGMIVQHVVLDHPDRVVALVLMDTSHGVPDDLDAEILALGREVVLDGGMPALLEAMRAMESDMLDTPAHQRLLAERDGYREFGDDKLLASSPAMWVAMIDEILGQPDRLERLRDVDVPTLVIVGEQDTAFIAHAERMAKAIPGAILEVIPNAGHSPQFENPDAWWTALTSFLDGVA